MKSAIAQAFGERNNERRFAGSANREISDADDGMVQPQRRAECRIRKASLAPEAGSGTRCSPARLDRLEKLKHAIRGAGVLLHDGECIATQFCSVLRIGEKVSKSRVASSRGVLDLDCGIRIEKQPRHVAKVFHVRSEDDRFAVPRRLENIVAARRNQRSSHEDDRCVLKHGRKFADAYRAARIARTLPARAILLGQPAVTGGSRERRSPVPLMISATASNRSA